MQSKKWFFGVLVLCGVCSGAFAADEVIEDIVDIDMEQVSADAVAGYDVNGSLFQQITDLEQEKVLMQLEKERAQLDLELDRLAAEKIKLHMEIDTLSGRAEQQQQEIETQKAKLEAEAARIEKEKETLLSEVAEEKSARESGVTKKDVSPKPETDIKFNTKTENLLVDMPDCVYEYYVSIVSATARSSPDFLKSTVPDTRPLAFPPSVSCFPWLRPKTQDAPVPIV